LVFVLVLKLLAQLFNFLLKLLLVELAAATEKKSEEKDGDDQD